MRLIDADKLLKDMVAVCSPTQFGRETAKMMVKAAPTIDHVHAAGYCYCRECGKRYDCEHYTGSDYDFEGEDFCSHGKLDGGGPHE